MDESKNTELVEVTESEKTEEVITPEVVPETATPTKGVVADKALKIKETFETANEVKAMVGIAAADVKAGKLQVGTVSRLIMLIIVWANQLMVMFGGYPQIPEIPESTIYLISTIITIAVSLYGFWSSNSWSKDAKTSDIVKRVMDDTGISVDEVVTALDDVVDRHYKEKAIADAEIKAKSLEMKSKEVEGKTSEHSEAKSEDSNKCDREPEEPR